MKKTFTLLCLLALVLPSLVWASDGNDHVHKGPNAAIKKYVKEQIMPVLLQKRQQFDRELNASEKTEIAECRAALKQLQSQHQRHDWKGNGDNTPAPDHTQVSQMPHSNPNFEQRKAIMDRVQAIADKHSNSLQDIKTQLEPARKQWVSDIKKLQPVSDDAKSDNNYYGKRHAEHGPESFLHSGHFMAVHFLLLSANPAENENQNEGELKSETIEAAPASSAPVVNLTAFEIMPNPATNDVQLGNDILPATNELRITDLQGKEVLSLENVQAAQHINVSQFASGTYLIQIKSGDQVISKKLVVNR